MSKFKSRFEAKQRPIKKSPAGIWCVDIYEHEEGWGQRLEDHFEFPSQEAATKYAQQTNAEFLKHGSSECFALAHPPYRKKDISQ